MAVSSTCQSSRCSRQRLNGGLQEGKRVAMHCRCCLGLPILCNAAAQLLPTLALLLLLLLTCQLTLQHCANQLQQLLLWLLYQWLLCLRLHCEAAGLLLPPGLQLQALTPMLLAALF